MLHSGTNDALPHTKNLYFFIFYHYEVINFDYWNAYEDQC